jgi:acetyl-CoA acetyltransferase
MQQAVIAAAARTAIGKFGGTLARIPAPNGFRMGVALAVERG